MAELVRQMNLKRMPVNRKLIGWIFVLTGLISGWLWWREQKPEFEPFKISYLIENKEVMGERDASRETGRLVTQIRSKTGTAQGSWAVAVYRLDEKKGYGVGEDKVLPAASIMKVPILLTTMKKLEPEETYILRDGDKQSGSGPIEFMEAGAKLTVKQLMEYMIKNSDNTATLVLARMAGKGETEKEIERLGMKNTNFKENTTTAADLVTMWKKIYEEGNTQMQELLKDSIYEDRIPLGLPDGVGFIHKVGTDAGVWADAGIVQCPVLSAQCSVKPLVIVILNKDVDMDEAKKLVPELVKLIWDFEAGRNVKPR